MRKHLSNAFGVALSFLMMMSSLYQLEIILIDIVEHRWFDWPFYLFPHPSCVGDLWLCPQYWHYMSMVRDFWYGLIIGAFVLLFLSIWYWED